MGFSGCDRKGCDNICGARMINCKHICDECFEEIRNIFHDAYIGGICREKYFFKQMKRFLKKKKGKKFQLKPYKRPSTVDLDYIFSHK